MLLFPNMQHVYEYCRCIVSSNVYLLVCIDMAGGRNNQAITDDLEAMAQALQN